MSFRREGKKRRRNTTSLSRASFKSQFEPQSMSQHLRDLAIVLVNGKFVHGIKGNSPLGRIPDFDFIKAFIPEYMHSCCQGVFKMFINLWTSPKYSKMPWYVGHKKKIINCRLAQIKPSYEVTRLIDSLDDLSNWKASMYRSFALYFFVIIGTYCQPSILFTFQNLATECLLLCKNQSPSKM